MAYILVGGLNSSVYVPPPVCIFHGSYGIYLCTICLQCVYLILCIPISLYTYYPIITLNQLCGNLSMIGQNIWGMYAYVSFHMQVKVHVEICYIT